MSSDHLESQRRSVGTSSDSRLHALADHLVAFYDRLCNA